MRNKFILASIGLASLIGTSAVAADPASCKTVRFADVGWAESAVTVGSASAVLNALGYETTSTLLSVPVSFASLSSGDVDAFLSTWLPTMDADVRPYLDDGTVDIAAVNLEGAKYTLATSRKTYEEGLHDFSDIAAFRDKIGNKIYGAEPGNDGNRIVLGMIDEDAFGLSGFELVEATEPALLAAVQKMIDKGEEFVFLGWAPHPMNARFDIEYLTGGDEYFGPDFGGATVSTAVRGGYAEECPNAARLLTNLKFTVEMENEIMVPILYDGVEAQDALRAWIKAHPDVVTPWLEGVTTIDGGDAASAVKAALGL